MYICNLNINISILEIMKKLLYTALTALLLAFYSCGGGSENKGAENVDTKAEANQIIAYTNDVVDYLNESGDWMRRNESAINDMIKAMESKRKPRFISPIISAGSYKTSKLKVETPPTVMSEDEQKLFSETMTAYKTTYASMSEKCGELRKYIQNEDFKDDDYAKGKVLADSIKSQYSYLNETKSMMYEKIDAVSEKAENIILQDHPLRDPILTMKAEMQNFTDLYDAFFDYSEGNKTPEEVDAAYQKVAASVEKNKAEYKSILDENKKTSRYEYFYKEADDALATYRKALRDVKAKKKVSDSTFRSFSSDNNSLIGAYNSFVN